MEPYGGRELTNGRNHCAWGTARSLLFLYAFLASFDEILARALARLNRMYLGWVGMRVPRLKLLVICFCYFLNGSMAFADDRSAEPFSFADFTWLNGNSRQTDYPLKTQYFTGQISLDANYVHQFHRPSDHTLVGSSNAGRTGEVQLQHLGVGGDFNYDNVRARVMTQFGMYSTMTPRNDASPSRGQWNIADAYRYLSEAYGGYHWDKWHGINLDFGIFMSYIGLCSYYNYDNWIYQMSYVSANTPWFFNGARLQMFPTDRLKVEVWLINGWQSYGMYHEMPGSGFQIAWRPQGYLSMVTNNYYGSDTLGIEKRTRIHSDSSLQVKYMDSPANVVSKAAFSLTLDGGCETGGGVGCSDQYFLGLMAYNRIWFQQDKYAVTIGGGMINNPGRYLVLVPPINGATASSGSASFSAAPNDSFRAWDSSITFDYMPKQAITYRIEFIHRESNVPYFAGRGGVTPPNGNQGPPGSAVAGWAPDLEKSESRINLAVLIRL